MIKLGILKHWRGCGLDCTSYDVSWVNRLFCPSSVFVVNCVYALHIMQQNNLWYCGRESNAKTNEYVGRSAVKVCWLRSMTGVII